MESKDCSESEHLISYLPSAIHIVFQILSELQLFQVFSSLSPSPAGLVSSPRLTRQDSSLSPAGFEFESRC